VRGEEEYPKSRLENQPMSHHHSIGIPYPSHMDMEDKKGVKEEAKLRTKTPLLGEHYLVYS